MEKRSVVLGVLITILVGAGLAGAATAVDKLVGPDTPEVHVERINDTHAAVSWTTDRPTHGTLSTLTQHQCNGSWIGINTVNDSSVSRSHLVIAPIYDLNRSRMNQTQAILPKNSYTRQYMEAPPKRYQVTVGVDGDGSGASKEILTRNLSQTCQYRH